MPVKVTLMTDPSLRLPGTKKMAGLSIGKCRSAETIASVPGTTTVVALDNEVAVIVSTESATIIAAHGSTPDAATTTATGASTAGYAIPPGIPVTIALSAGDLINFKTFA